MILCPPCFLFGRSSQAVYHCCPLQEAPMPRDTKSGKFVLEAVRREQVAAQAERTARAIARCSSLIPDVEDLTQGSSSAPPIPPAPPAPPVQTSSYPDPISPHLEDGPWDRHIFGGGAFVVFSRGREAAISIRKNPDGFGWFIDLSQASDTTPPNPPRLPE
jgi:hypothetical protein